MNILESFSTAILPLEAHSHEDHAGGFWAEFFGLLTDPAHLAFELVFSLVFDLIIVTLIYGVLIQKVIIPRLRKSIHAEIDREHGIEHKENTEGNNPVE